MNKLKTVCLAVGGLIAVSLSVNTASAQAGRAAQKVAEIVGLVKAAPKIEPLSARLSDGPIYGYGSRPVRGPKTFDVNAEDRQGGWPEMADGSDGMAFMRFCASQSDRDFAKIKLAKRDLVRGILHGQGIRGSDLDDAEQEVWLRFVELHKEGKCASHSRNPRVARYK